ncbi:hypothetical protein JMG10_13310 [Nostoc ellipsosporum NOK]|nr:hypothetical protein [Nostoc ellipsosporum NOK]
MMLPLGACSAPSNNADDRSQWLKANANDPRQIDKRFGSEATRACDAEADDYLRKIAAYDFAWDEDAKGLLGIKFGQISTRSAGPNMLTLVADRAKLSNGFGAYQHVTVYCLYDAMKGNVVGFSQDDPAIQNGHDLPDAWAGPPNTGPATPREEAPARDAQGHLKARAGAADQDGEEHGEPSQEEIDATENYSPAR